MSSLNLFSESFALLTGHSPMRWQQRLFEQFVLGKIPASLDLPTGLGKTSVMPIWLLARAFASKDALNAIPRRLVYVVDRRAVVDQATAEAEKLRKNLQGSAGHLKERLGLREGALPISTLRGAHVDNREWLADPSAPAIIVGTVDMIGSRLLFEGYGVSRKMRPFHAGLLGVDTLLVLDEAHLVPPFADLLRTIERDPSLWPKDRTPLPRFVVLPLSATQREWPVHGRTTFGLEEEDRGDDVASLRLNAQKQLRVEPLAEKNPDKQLAETAFALATKGAPSRVVVFCNRREKRDDGGGPSAQGVAEAIEALAKGDKKSGREKIEIHAPELLVGARRVHERDEVAMSLEKLGFTGNAPPADKPAFLVATSAGEVGVDVDADHMVCDLAPWERMVQRLGRVNRRGGESRKAEVVVFDTSGIEKDEVRKGRLTATRALLGKIEADLDGKGGPAALLELREQVGQRTIKEASTPEPLHPAMTRALAEVWSMTSLENHTGRPEIAPWLRGWFEPQVQTTVVWRKYLPLHVDDRGRPSLASKKETNEFFGAAPPLEIEKLETEAFRVADWLRKRAATLLQRKAPRKIIEPSGAEELPEGDEEVRVRVPEPASELRRDDIVVLILSASAEYEKSLTLGQLAQERKGRAVEDFHDGLVGKILIVDARFGGLTDGLLEDGEDTQPSTADEPDEGWREKVKFRVRMTTRENETNETEWRVEDDFVLSRDADGDPVRWLVVEHFKSVAQSEEGRAISKPQTLADHQSLAERKIREIAARLGLSGIAVEVLVLAACLHDEGKKAPPWQRAFRAERDARKHGLSGPLAKTRGPIDHKVLDGYRHEFGSLAVFEPATEAAKQLRPEVRKRIDALPEDWRDLLLHLIAAHHGHARPVIEERGCEDAPLTALRDRAREVGLRFARLQKRWGPWGLAWWESLLRAADQQASRDNDASDRGEDAPSAVAEAGVS
ncbi:MAG: type I-U CRISPR-associated helicase/endonuclease Cas3 [Hyphomicrobiales bacterium]|nr:type I-U CRISPR-associated helicase/endonuclease Cas3 [Hyphomicrobiales bacterium]MBW0003083.1 type I-U CRISPR-associated helicase/endonuclease Cas3 [Hyphomicrobiales bacterium]